MKTKELTVCSLMTALYGVLLVVDAQSAWLLESTLPFLFALPCLIAAGMYGQKAGLLGGLAMGVLTCLLAPISSWLLLFPLIAAGFWCGYGEHRGSSRLWILIGCTCLLGAMEFASYTLMADVLGLDTQLEEQLYLLMQGRFSLQALLLLAATFQGFLQSLLLELLAMVLHKRLSSYFPPARPLHLPIPHPAFGWWFLILTALLVYDSCIEKCPAFLRDLALLAWAGIYLVLAYTGWRYALDRLPHPSRRQLIFLNFAALLPPFQVLLVLYGEGRLLMAARGTR